MKLNRLCAWCGGPIPATARSDAKTCRQSCRQAAHRFAAGRPRHLPHLGRAAAEPMRVCYADPPYPDMARRYYRDHDAFAGEVDHGTLVARLVAEFPDGWALSTSAAALPDVLAICPSGVRVAAWFRGERPTRSYAPLNAWEPVVFAGGRLVLSEVDERRVDALVYAARPRRTDPARVVGTKPAAFLWWMLRLLGVRPGDEVVDLFPGSGGLGRAVALLEASTPAAVSS